MRLQDERSRRKCGACLISHYGEILLQIGVFVVVDAHKSLCLFSALGTLFERRLRSTWDLEGEWGVDAITLRARDWTRSALADGLPSPHIFLIRDPFADGHRLDRGRATARWVSPAGGFGGVFIAYNRTHVEVRPEASAAHAHKCRKTSSNTSADSDGRDEFLFFIHVLLCLEAERGRSQIPWKLN